MFGSLALALSGIIFVSLIAAIYFTKKKYNNIENNIYRALLIITIILLISKFVCGYTMYHREEMPILNEMSGRICILFAITWFVVAVAYMRLVLSDIKYKSTRDFISDKYVIGFTIVCSFLFVLSSVLRLDYTSGPNGEYTVLTGPAIYYMYIAFIFVSLYIFKFLFTGLNKDTFLKRLPVFLFIGLFYIMEIIEYFYADINALPFIISIFVVTVYFTIENQDSMLASELEKAKRQSEKADKDKTEFLSKMSHEIRTPMNAIMGFSESLLETKKMNKEDTMKDVKNIYNAGKSLLEIINNILVFSRIESGKESVDEIEYNLMDIVSELESYIYTKIDPNEVKFAVDINQNIPAKYYGDKLKVYRIILNLLNNSVKYTEKGTITLSINYLKDSDAKEHLLFKVIDTGLGMDDEDYTKITNEFKSEDEVLGESSGPGLGLSVVKKIVEMMGAEISFKSKPGIGTEFDVDIIQKSVGSELIKDAKKNSELSKDMYFDCSKYKILIVDDNKLNLKVTGRLLEHYNIKYEVSNSGRECIERIKSGEKFDLILLDHLMPELDGIETIRILKRLDVKKVPPVVAMTANVVTELKETYINEGFDDYIAKPVDIKDLNNLMNKYFRKKRKKRGN